MPTRRSLLATLAATGATATSGCVSLGNNSSQERVERPTAQFELTSEIPGQFTITHVGGEPLSQQTLDVRYRPESESDIEKHEFKWEEGAQDSDSDITEGDAFVSPVPALPGTDVRLVWISPEGARSLTYDFFSIPITEPIVEDADVALWNDGTAGVVLYYPPDKIKYGNNVQVNYTTREGVNVTEDVYRTDNWTRRDDYASTEYTTEKPVKSGSTLSVYWTGTDGSTVVLYEEVMDSE